jgi:hypothetical protein
MPRQNINTGATPNDGTGDALRIAFTKTNSNFIELYNKDTELTVAINTLANTIPTDVSQLTDTQEIIPDRDYNRLFNKPFIPSDVSDLTDVNGLLGGSGGGANVAWFSSSNTIFNAVKWNSGSTVEIGATPLETVTLIAYDSRTDSNSVYFAWNQEFINDVWEGYNHPIGGGEYFEISLDDGETWLEIERSGYSGGSFFYFYVPWEKEGQYTFTYNTGQEILMRFNRGSLPEVWFDLQESNIPLENIQFVVMDVMVIGTVNEQVGKKFYNSVTFSNELYNNDNSTGEVESNQSSSSGAYSVHDSIRSFIRMSEEPEDAGRLYAKFNAGKSGSMTFYWNATIYTVT